MGEATGHVLGYVGNGRGVVERLPAYGRISGWVRRYGPLAVFAVSLQPVLAFDIAGALAGASKMPLPNFDSRRGRPALETTLLSFEGEESVVENSVLARY